MESLEDRTVPSNLNLSASASPPTVQLGSDVSVAGSVMASDPMTSISVNFGWGDTTSDSDSYSYPAGSTMSPVGHNHTYTSIGNYTITVTAAAGYLGGGNDTVTETYAVSVTTNSPPPSPPPPPPNASIQFLSASDAAEDGTVGEFEIRRMGGDLTQPLTVAYIVATSSTATPGADYEALSGTVTFAENATTATFTVTAIDDAILDPNETVTVTLSNGSGYTVQTPAGMLTVAIGDNESQPITSQNFALIDPVTNQQVDVAVSVLLNTPDAQRLFTWNYTVSNPAVNSSSWMQFTIPVDTLDSNLDGVVVPYGWSKTIANDSVNWVASSGGIAPGTSTAFSFRSAPLRIGTGIVVVGGPGGTGGGLLLGTGGGPVPGAKPQVFITDANGKQAAHLKVAKWQEAFQRAADNKSDEIKGPTAGTNLDFIDRDVDRFNVWVLDTKEWDATPRAKHIQVSISTKNVAGFTAYDDNPTAVDLVPYTGNYTASGPGSGPGWFWSDSQILVSNQVDDKFESGADYVTGGKYAGTVATYLGLDEAPSNLAKGLPKNGYNLDNTWFLSDRTHRVALRGTVKAEYTVGVVKYPPATADVPAQHTVKLHITNVREQANFSPDFNDAKILADVVSMREIYAQVGLSVELVDAKDNKFSTISPPTGVNLSDGYGHTAEFILNAGKFDTFWRASRRKPDVEFCRAHTSGLRLDARPKPGRAEYNKGLLVMVDEERKLLAANRTAAKDDIEVYYVNKFTVVGIKGCSYSESEFTTEDAKLYADSAVISSSILPGSAAHSVFTLAHESFHVLENRPKSASDHYPYDKIDPIKVNLMVDGKYILDSGAVIDSRRLTVDQQLDANSKRPNLLAGPG